MDSMLPLLALLSAITVPALCNMGGCPPIVCLNKCSNGYKTDMYGCRLCECKPAAKMQAPQMPRRPIMVVPVMCPVPKCPADRKCPDGFQKDSRGCQTCNCKRLNLPCPPGVMKVNCPVSPCNVAKCPIFPTARCVESFCGGCYAAFYVNGIKVTC